MCCTGWQVQVENLHGSESHSLQLRVHGEYCGLQYCTLQCCAERQQVEVWVGVAVGGVLVLLTAGLLLYFIIYFLVRRDSCCLRPALRPRNCDGSEMGR